jgi:hypothetical protein
MLGDMGDGRILALRSHNRLILALRAQDAPSTHFLEIHMFQTVNVIFGNVTLDIFEHHNSEDGMLETHTMTIIRRSECCQKCRLEYKVQSQFNTYS